MKKLLFLLMVVGPSAMAQVTSYKNFVISDRELIYQCVVDTAVHIADYVQFLETLPTVKISHVSDDYVIAEFYDLVTDFRKYGYKWGNTPMFIQNYDLAGKLRIDIKPDKYRITLNGIKLVNGKSRQFALEDDLSTFAMKNKRDGIRPGLASPDALGIYDRFLNDYFSIKRINSQW